MSSKGWYAFDLDGTLAYYNGWQGVEHIGAPVPAMLAKVQALLDAGEEVRIFTARVCVNELRDEVESRKAERAIKRWCVAHIGIELPVTNVKDFGMIRLYDDRCVQVVPNEGREIVDAGVPCPQCSAEAVACVTQGDQKWLKCAACGQDFERRSL